MTSTSISISLDDAVEGMVLATDLRHGNAVLLPAGSSLTGASLNALRRRDIACIDVVPGANAADAALEQAEAAAALAVLRERQCARLAHLFRNCVGATGAGTAAGSAAVPAADDASALLLARLMHFRQGSPA